MQVNGSSTQASDFVYPGVLQVQSRHSSKLRFDVKFKARQAATEASSEQGEREIKGKEGNTVEKEEVSQQVLNNNKKRIRTESVVNQARMQQN